MSTVDGFIEISAQLMMIKLKHAGCDDGAALDCIVNDVPGERAMIEYSRVAAVVLQVVLNWVPNELSSKTNI